MNRISVIIPAYNEADYLPITLKALGTQTLQPFEVIVVNRDSTDDTIDIARKNGAIVLQEGGHPATSRNMGARAAKGDWLLFLDADTDLHASTLEQLFHAAQAKRRDVVSCWFKPDDNSAIIRVMHWASCYYFWITSRLGFEHSIGACILVRRSLHNAIGGFDESIHVGEDQDYVRRAAKLGKYSFLRKPVIQISSRRFLDEGILRLALTWLAVDVHRLLLGEIRTSWIKYFK